MDEIEEYTKKYLSRELQEVERSERVNELLELSIYEKTCIFKYSLDAYETLNENLRISKGINNSEFGIVLEQCLAKLADFDGLVYRGVNLSPGELDKYRNGLIDDQPITEYPFISTSKSRMVAMEFRANVLFRIYSKFGKEIEKIAKYGLYNAQNEKEVLFKPNSIFNVLEITKESDYTLITLEEV
jgi:hypothetical protein